MALTGGIASGKSTVCGFLREFLPGAVIFDCDVEVRKLLEGDRETAAEISARFGPRFLTAAGKPDRAALRAKVFPDAAARAELEAVLHPRVREECLARRDEAAKSGADLFVADVPLLFEKGFDFGQTVVLLAASSRSVQIQRLKTRGGFELPLIDGVLAAQLPVQQKIDRSDVVFWNDGPLPSLCAQVRRFCRNFPSFQDSRFSP